MLLPEGGLTPVGAALATVDAATGEGATEEATAGAAELARMV